jgi:hypothetical protein
MRFLLLKTEEGELAINAAAVASVLSVDDGRSAVLTLLNFDQHTVPISFHQVLQVLMDNGEEEATKEHDGDEEGAPRELVH